MTKTRTHQWVKHTVTKVHVVPNFEEEGIVAIADPAQVQEAEDKAVFGCEVCDAILTPETSSTPCPGPADD